MSEVLEQVSQVNQQEASPIFAMNFRNDESLKLGKAFRVGSKATAQVSQEGGSIEFYVPTVTVLIGIGTDHVAHLVMTKEAFDALNEGQPVKFINFKK